MIKCGETFVGAERKTEEGDEDYYDNGQGTHKPSQISPFYHKPRNLYNTGQAVCGAKGCTRACMISLEARGVLKNKFENPFRTQKPWHVDWSQETIEVDYKAPYEGLDSPNAKKKDETRAD